MFGRSKNRRGITCPRTFTHADVQIKPIIIHVFLKDACIFLKKGKSKGGERAWGRERGQKKEKGKSSLMFISDGNFPVTRG